MTVEVFDNATRAAGRVLTSALEGSGDVRIAVAFVSAQGLSRLQPALAAACERGGRVEFVIGLDGSATEPKALEALFRMAQTAPRAELYCRSSLGARGRYHPKLYLSRVSEDNVTCLIGSSNLTGGGLAANAEVNIALRGACTDEPIASAYEVYLRLKLSEHAFVPDEATVEAYAELWSDTTKARRRHATQPSSREIEERLRRATEGRARPLHQRHDLVGWLDLVYDAAPEGEFTNADLYARAAEFARRFPDNRYVRAKIRQQLQRLRDLGFLEDLGPGRWRKL